MGVDVVAQYVPGVYQHGGYVCPVRQRLCHRPFEDRLQLPVDKPKALRQQPADEVGGECG